MRPTRPVYFTILPLFLTLLTINISVQAADDDDADDYDVKARVVRISFVAGEVNLKRDGNTEVENARVNFPLVEGDVLSTSRDGRVEIQIDAHNFVRLGGDSVLQITTLRDEGIALSLNRGTASVRLAKFNHDHQYFEIDAPKTTLAAEKEGLYRLDVSGEGHVRLTARSGGRARIYSETSGFVLRDGRTAGLIYDGPEAGDWEFTTANAADSWDTWVDDRERYLAARMRYDVQYYDNYLWGAEDLDAYGSWSYAEDYGWVWRPNITVINKYDNWAPYRYGNWTYCPPYGWTWVGYEPWGWAPYHYGRWVYHNNYWAWCPRSQYYRHRSWWRPALVAFVSVNLSLGDSYCWYPLHYNQRDPHSRNYQAHDRRHGGRNDGLANLRRHNPAYYRAVTSLPAGDFGTIRARLRPADNSLARRVVVAEPLRADLPRPALSGHERATAGERPVDRPIITPPIPARADIGQRPTGAMIRRPGVALDDDLRRSRIFNGRGAQPDFPVQSAGAGPVESRRPTGAVTRPRPAHDFDPRRNGGRDAQRGSHATDHPVTNGNAAPGNDVPVRHDPGEAEPAPVRIPVRPPVTEDSSLPDRPARPYHTDRSAPVENHDRGQRERSENPAPRYEPASRNAPPPSRNEPRPRKDSPPRHDPPPPRNEDHDRTPSKIKDPR